MIAQDGVMTLTPDEEMMLRPTEEFTPGEAQMIRAAARVLRARRLRMLVRCDVCFTGSGFSGMRGEINPASIFLECRCRKVQFNGATL